jgi:hypothetical protein
MTTQSPNVQESINNGVAQQMPDMFRQLGLGSMLGAILQGMTPTEAGVVPAANVATLANAAGYVWHILATAGVFTGILNLKIGDASVLPESGEAVWAGPGSTTLRLNAADAITAVSVWYGRADGVNTQFSAGSRSLGQSDD